MGLGGVCVCVCECECECVCVCECVSVCVCVCVSTTFHIRTCKMYVQVHAHNMWQLSRERSTHYYMGSDRQQISVCSACSM